MPSITAHKPAKTVKIDKPRQIRYNWAAGNRFEEAYGKSIPEAMKVNIGTRLITHLAWAGMLHDEPSLTLRETERRIQSFVNQDGDINVLAEDLITALVDSNILGKAKAEESESEPEGNGEAVPQE